MATIILYHKILKCGMISTVVLIELSSVLRMANMSYFLMNEISVFEVEAYEFGNRCLMIIIFYLLMFTLQRVELQVNPKNDSI